MLYVCLPFVYPFLYVKCIIKPEHSKVRPPYVVMGKSAGNLSFLEIQPCCVAEAAGSLTAVTKQEKYGAE